MLHSDQSQIILRAKFTYSRLEKSLENQTKATEYNKQSKSNEDKEKSLLLKKQKEVLITWVTRIDLVIKLILILLTSY